MLDFLNYFGNKVVGRYKTVESNIRNRSNSFYDSFLDLLEDTIKTILMNEDIGYDGRTCGEILREPDVNNFFKHRINVDKDIYSKVSDYIRKINEHKHHNEKYINVDTVVNYMNTFYLFVTPYVKYKTIEYSPFNEAYYRGIFGVTLERSKELDNVTQKVDEFVYTTNTKLGEHESRLASLEALTIEFNKRQMEPSAQSSTSHNQSHSEMSEKAKREWFFRNSKKSWRWFGNQSLLNKKKTVAIVSYALLFVFGFFSSVATSLSAGFYTTFTAFENAWLICGISLLVYTIKTKLKYESKELARNTNYSYKQDQYGLWNPGKEKTIFKVLRWLAVICVIANIIYIWIRPNNLSIVATVLEIIFLGAIVFSFFANIDLFAQYTIIYLEGKSIYDSDEITLVWDPYFKKFFTEDEYRKKMSFLFEEIE